MCFGVQLVCNSSSRDVAGTTEIQIPHLRIDEDQKRVRKLSIEMYSGKLCGMSTQLRYLKFGGYLLAKMLITELDILKARFLQRKNNLRIGELARARGWLTEDDVERILIIQEDTCEKFGQIAVREKLLTEEQLEYLLKEQQDSYIFFGEALVYRLYVECGAYDSSNLSHD